MPVCRDSQLVSQFEAEEVEDAGLSLWWLTQASWLIKSRRVRLAIDPWWRDVHADGHWQKLLGEYPLHPDGFPELDYVLCTHWHDDHLCPETIPRLAAAQPSLRFVIPSRSVELVESWGVESERIIPAHGHGPIDLDGLKVWCVPAAHEELDFDETGASWYVGYVIESGGATLFHMGDGQPWPGWYTAVKRACSRLREDGGLDVALLCINGNDNLRHDQAVDLVMDVGPELVVPMHYGMDPGNTVDPVIFIDEVDSRCPNQSFQIPEVGGLIRFGGGQE